MSVPIVAGEPGLPRADEPRYRGWREALARHGYGGLLAIALTATYLAMALGATPGAAASASVLATALSLLALERLLPYAPGWMPTGRGFGIDLTHSLVSAYAIAPAVRAALAVGLAGLRTGGVGPWPTTWPLPLQLVGAVVVADLGAYCAHRFMHVTRIGWRMHAVHHSPRRLNFIASARSHPFNVVLTFGCETGLLIALGIPPATMALWTVVKGANGLLQHCNVDLRPGALDGVLATCDVHRWHHSVVRGESETNFGNTTVVWDRLLGTYFLPEGRRPGMALGIDDADIPESYLAHLAVPFALGRFERS